MIIAQGGRIIDGQMKTNDLCLIGLTADNVEALMRGQPILIPRHLLQEGDLILFYGLDNESLSAKVGTAEIQFPIVQTPVK